RALYQAELRPGTGECKPLFDRLAPTPCAVRYSPAMGASLAVRATVMAAALAAAGPAAAREPFQRGVLLRGSVVTMDGRDRVIRQGSLLVRGQRIVALWQGARAPRGVRTRGAIVVAPRGALIFPGLINLHDHPSWSVLPPWPPPTSNAQPAFGRP